MEKKTSLIKDAIDVLVGALVLYLFCANFLLYGAVVDGSSMYPELVDGEKVFSFIIKRKLGISRFDICVIDTDKSDKLLVKRVIGLPGETVSYTDNVLYINGEAVEEDFLGEDVYTNDISYTLGEDEYFCLGDNRQISRDSRYYGAFTGDEIVSTGIFVCWPFNKIGMH